MSYAIIVGSYRGSPWLSQCLDSIPSRFPTIAVSAGKYECSALRWCMDNTTLDEFLFLQDSTMIKSPEWLDAMFADVGVSYSINAEPNIMGSFLGKYRREILQHVTIPTTEDKWAAVVAEQTVGSSYHKLEPGTKILWPELNLRNAQPGHLFGRDVMIYENDHFWKAKSAWSGTTLTPCCERDKAHRELYP